MKQRLKQWIARQQYAPGRLGWIVNPFFLARRALWLEMTRLLPRMHGVLLDVGCGSQPYRELARVDRYVGLDYDVPDRREAAVADLFYDGGVFPVADADYDSVLCTQVLEHVFNPDQFLGEISRCMRPNGVLVLSVPFVWDEHSQPHDCARYSTFGLRAMFARAGLEIEEHTHTLNDGRVLVQLGLAYLYKITLTRWTWVNLLTTVLIMAPLNLLGILLGWVSPRNPDFYLDHVVWARKRAEPTTSSRPMP